MRTMMRLTEIILRVLKLSLMILQKKIIYKIYNVIIEHEIKKV